ncbi:methionine aminopeptidase 1D, mitochondrial-like [Asterias rubens]|uniref:methionine aminopeptidase 1D, mitochondrial-like n=1 Tax=Asterias rubens TaxID=7604 RepID=UPI001455A44E|nr:methionine aminopeptidase 1D, mitochondrial-like [Asterias rubens]
MAASMRSLKCLQLQVFKSQSKLLASASNARIPQFKAGYHTANSTVSRRVSPCTSCRWNQFTQQKRTFFGIFKKTPEPEPVREEDLAYRVVTPRNVSARRTVPDSIKKPEYAVTGKAGTIRPYPVVLNRDEADRMRDAGAMARKILDIGASYVKPGVTTDFIDEKIHAACLENRVYPSTLNYKGFPKSVCTSINNVVCHGVPDDRPLEEGDIVNVDFTVFMGGYHGDVSETYVVGSVDGDGQRLIDAARLCLDEAIKKCGPQVPIAEIGNTIESIARAAGFHVCPSFVGHGIGRLFHCKPDIWHYANTYPERMLPGMAFTIEPVILENTDSIFIAEDNWTVLAQRHTRSAQFEHTVLVNDFGVEVLTAFPQEYYESGSKSTMPSSASSGSSKSSENKESSEGHDDNKEWKFD